MGCEAAPPATTTTSQLVTLLRSCPLAGWKANAFHGFGTWYNHTNGRQRRGLWLEGVLANENNTKEKVQKDVEEIYNKAGLQDHLPKCSICFDTMHVLDELAIYSCGHSTPCKKCWNQPSFYDWRTKCPICKQVTERIHSVHFV